MSVLGLVLPEGEASDDAFTLAHGETNMRLRGERQPAFDQLEVAEESGFELVERRVHVRGHYVYRTRRGQFTSRRKWARSHGRRGKYVQAWQDGYYYYRTRGATRVSTAAALPPLPRERGPFETLAEAGEAFAPVAHGPPLSGPALDRRLRALGLEPLALTIQGAYSDVPGGPLFLWAASGPAIGGLTLATYPALLDQLTRDWRNDNASPPVILVSRLGVAPLDDSP